MLFRPKFCANCGEKIERSDWGLLTSRRFCPVCEIEFQGQEMIPRVVVGISVLVAAVSGFGYLRSGPRAPETAVARPVRAATQVSQGAPPAPTASPALAQRQPEMPVNSTAKPFVSQAPSATAVPRVEAVSETYFCGAETKKGTPCSRRVKGNVRCYQHKGMPAMLPADKLKIG